MPTASTRRASGWETAPSGVSDCPEASPPPRRGSLAGPWPPQSEIRRFYGRRGDPSEGVDSSLAGRENSIERIGQDAVVRASTRDLRSDAAVISESVGDPACFSVIFERHFDVLYGYLARRVGHDLAQDLTSEVFAVAFRRRAVFDADQLSARPWLFGMASNLLRNHARAERRQLRAFGRTGVDPVMPDAEAEADQRLDAERAGPAIARALLRLRSEDMEVLLLFAWGSLSYDEIAQTLRLPIGTVRSRLARARRQLRELLGSEGQLVIVETDEGDER